MTSSQFLVANLSAALMLLTATGLVVNRRVRLCRSFFVYLVVVSAGTLLAAWIQEVFYTQDFWTRKKTAYGLIRAAMAFEIALLTFIALPRARKRALVCLGLVMASLTAVMVTTADNPENPYLKALGVTATHQDTASLWMFVAVMAVAVFHHAPMHPFHRRLLLTFTMYLAVETWLLGLVGVAGGSRPDALAAYAYLEALDPLAFAITTGFWTWGAWRAEGARELSPAVAARLQPWAA
jgi:hypothetical protein